MTFFIYLYKSENKKKFIDIPYVNLFLKDISTYIFYSLKKDPSYCFETKYKEGVLYDYLSNNQSDFIFLIENCIRDIIIFSNSFVSIQNTNNLLLQSLSPYNHIKILNSLYLKEKFMISKKKYSNKEFFEIKYKKIGINRSQLNKFINNLFYYDITTGDATNNSFVNKVDFSIYDQEKYVNILASSKSISWSFKDSHIKELSKFYFLVRNLRYRVFQIKIITMVLNQINQNIKNIIKTQDEIIFVPDYSINEYENCIHDLSNGNKSFKDAYQLISPSINK